MTGEQPDAAQAFLDAMRSDQPKPDPSPFVGSVIKLCLQSARDSRFSDVERQGMAHVAKALQSLMEGNCKFLAHAIAVILFLKGNDELWCKFNEMLNELLKENLVVVQLAMHGMKEHIGEE
jgi:hypothetical protein